MADLLSVPQVAALKGVSPTTVNRWIHRGKLQATRDMWGRFVIDPRDIPESIVDLRSDPANATRLSEATRKYWADMSPQEREIHLDRQKVKRWPLTR